MANQTQTLTASREMRFLLSCARVFLGTAQADVLEVRHGTAPNWERVLEMARWHRLDPMVYEVLKNYPEGTVTAPVRARLAEAFQHNVRRNMVLCAVLAEIQDLARQRGLVIVPIKGLTLSQIAYGNLVVRRSRDLDLLVHPRDWQNAVALLEHLGFRQPVPLADHHRPILLGSAKELKFIRDGILVELHWRFADLPEMFPFPMDSLHESTETLALGGLSVPVLRLPHLIPYLCYHGCFHLWFRLFWLCDLAALTGSKAEPDWEQVVAEAAALQQTPCLLLGFGLARRLLENPVPAPIERLFHQQPHCGRLIDQLSGFLLRESGVDKPYAVHVSGFQTLRWSLHLRQGFFSKIRVGWRFLTQPRLTDLEAFPLPRRLFPLYRLIRPLRLLGRWLFAGG